MTTRLTRRRFLGGLGVAASVLPFVPNLDVHADDDPPPKRLLFFFSSNGTIREHWLPSMVDGQLSLSTILSPLEAHKRRLLVVDGLGHNVIMEKGDRSGHSAGMNTVLTGRKCKSIDPAHPLRSLGTGISLDQYLAGKLATGTKFRTLESGIQVQPFSTDDSSLSYKGPLYPLSAENSPYLVFDRVFGGFAAPDNAAAQAAAATRLADRKATLSTVSKSLDALKRRVPQSDRVKLDAHLDAVAALDHSLSTGVGVGASQSCARPSLGAKLDHWNNVNIPTISRLQIDLMVMALACDLTRIGTLQYGRAGAAHRFTWLGPEFKVDPKLAVTDAATGFHALAHMDVHADSRAKLVKIHTWYAGELAYLLSKLEAIPERGGTMLDNTVVVWINELGSGGAHTHEDTPWVIAGNTEKFFDTGKFVAFPGEPHNRILVSLLNAMGVDEDVFGDEDFCNAGALTGITT